jgi:DNA-binding NarL/FixJ family response regulator
LKLPKVDGLEMLRQIMGDSALKMIPVMMMTSSREENDLLQSYQPGVNASVVKPMKFQDFGGSSEAGRRVLERRPTLKVIYMSGYTDDTIVHHGVLDPGIAFLHKPFSSDTLGLKIREVLAL